MGRLASAVDWTEDGAGVSLRASEIRLQAPAPLAPSDEPSDDDEPTRPFLRVALESRDSTEQTTARGIARLSALVHWMELEGDGSSSAVVGLVRACLGDLAEVHASLSALSAAVGIGSEPPALGSAVHSLAVAVGLWRANLVEHIDDLALTDHRSFAGWSSLPEYSLAYTLAVVQPALDAVEAWAIARRGGLDLFPLVRDLGASVARLNGTLRTVSERPSGDAPNARGVSHASAW